MRSLWSRLIGAVRRALRLPSDRIEAAVRRFGIAHPDAFFVQIGANDGEARDPLRREVERRRWRGIMVEPVPYVFERLAERYDAHAGITLERAAIGERDGLLPFYHLREAAPGEEVWHWYHALGSFKRDVVLSHRDRIPDIESRIVEAQIPTLTFSSLCRKHNVAAVDLLTIDTEGYDYEILRSIDLAETRPRLIIYEHYHLSDADRAAARERLERAGYRCFEHGLDTAALDLTRLESTDDRLLALFEASS